MDKTLCRGVDVWVFQQELPLAELPLQLWGGPDSHLVPLGRAKPPELMVGCSCLYSSSFCCCLWPPVPITPGRVCIWRWAVWKKKRENPCPKLSSYSR